MKPTTPDPEPRSRRRLRLGLWLAVLTLPVVAILALPWALSTEPARVWLLSRANQVMAPGSVEIAALKFSWFGSTHFKGVVFRDAEGHRVVEAPGAIWDRNLFQILFDRPRLGTIRIDQAAIDAEHKSDDTINLFETLRPLFEGDPKTSLRIDVRDGRLHAHGKGLPRPIEAEHTSVSLNIHGEPGPITWTVGLANGNLDAPRQSLKVEGTLDRGGGASRGDLTLLVSGRAWPWAFADDRGTISGQLGGKLSATKTGARWSLAGDTALASLNVKGPDPDGRSFGIDQARVVWNLGQTAAGWTIQDVELTTSQALFKGRGTIAPDQVKLEGEAAWNGDQHTRWSVLGSFATREGVTSAEARLDLVQVLADAREGERLALQIKGSAPRDHRRIDLASLALDNSFLQVSASGRIDDPMGKRLADFSGTIAPNWDRLNEWLSQNVEPGARVKGREHPFRLRAALGETVRDTLDGELGVALDGADIYGMKFGPTDLVVRARGGKLSVDPIETTVNDGRLHLEPLIRNNDSEPLAILLDPGSTLTGAKVNDEVSRRVLSFAVPVLDNATSVRGQVSATIDKAVFPIGDLGETANPGPTIEGAIVFQDVEFLPGPLLDGLFALTGKPDRPALKLNQPVALKIADRRVYQRGLAIPIGNLTRFELEGSVGFDRSLDLIAGMPILPTMLADRPLLGAIAADARIRVPIRGTLQKPEIDREAFKIGMNDLGRSLLERGGLQGAVGLFERLIRPRDPDAPPPPTPEERRERRQERRDERKMRRQGMPPE